MRELEGTENCSTQRTQGTQRYAEEYLQQVD